MKKLRRLFRSKRAFSPVIAALILMLLAVAAGVVVYAYVMGWLGGATQTPGSTQGKLQYDSLYATASSDVIQIYVRNVGGKDLTLSDSIYVQGTKFTNASSLTTSLTVGSLAYLEVDTTGTIDLSQGYHYEVKVTCTDGTAVSQSVEAK
jgi:FlaG/FlaF family flagellin (archaellin)